MKESLQCVKESQNTSLEAPSNAREYRTTLLFDLDKFAEEPAFVVKVKVKEPELPNDAAVDGSAPVI